jgi:hypothetical protein
MPLVLTQNEATESGHAYSDVLGVSYEYPRSYRNVIRSGEPFVYYRGRRRGGGGLQPQAYLGVGVIGEISEGAAGLFRCGIDDYWPFANPLPFKQGDDYLEARARTYGSRAGLYFRQGVRVIDDEIFGRIVAAGGALGPDSVSAPPFPSSTYASPATAKLVDEIAIELALARATKAFGGVHVALMPHNNPGYDVRIDGPDGFRYIEVKGTTRSSPQFFISDGERRFSIEHADHYSLWIFFSIDIAARTGALIKHAGAVASPRFELLPIHYAGKLIS